MRDERPAGAPSSNGVSGQRLYDLSSLKTKVWQPLTVLASSTTAALMSSARSRGRAVGRFASGDDLTTKGADEQLLSQDRPAYRVAAQAAADADDATDATRQRPSLSARRRRLSRVSRTRNADPASRARLRAGLARTGFHGLMVAVGLTAAVTVWSGAGERLQVADSHADTVATVDTVNTADDALNPADDPVALSDDATDDTGPAGQPMQPLVRRVVEGDTLRSIAAEFSVSMSTILASNKLDNPDLIQPGQEIVIPPVDGVVADVKPGETLAQISERYGAQWEEVAQANALPNDPDRAISFERIIVPGRESADRAIGIARHDGPNGSASPAEGTVNLSTRSDIVSYEVQEGDTLGQLATQFGVSLWTILSANNLADPDLIRPGMRLKVLPVNGVEHEVQPGEKLTDIAEFYKVDLGPLIDFNGLSDPDNLKVGLRLTIPGAERPQPGFSLAGGGPAPAISVPVAAASSAASRPTANVAAAQRPAAQTTLAQARPPAPVAQARSAAPVAQAAARPSAPVAQAKPVAPVAQAKPAAKPSAPVAQAAPARNVVSAAAISAPVSVSPGGAGGSAVVSAAMRFLGSRYVFGGTSPAGFDCSGFVWYVHKSIGKPVSRGLWGQLNGGPRIALNALQPGDTVFFANTYMPGLSHVGIYIGGGRFIHASDESSGVKISSLSDSYWGPRYIGASRLY
ncbi:MAG: LysM peptidoglycan-binding domain-containing protein [Chloroflexota bacterium]